MVDDFVAVGFSNLVLASLYHLIKKLDDIVVFDIDHVIMVII